MATHDEEHTDEGNDAVGRQQVGRLIMAHEDDTSGYAHTAKKPEDEGNDASVGRNVTKFDTGEDDTAGYRLVMKKDEAEGDALKD